MYQCPFTLNPEGCGWTMFHVSNEAVVLETVKIASREVDCIVLRLYEAFGGHAKAVVSSSLNFASVVRCSMLEESEGKVSKWCGSIELQFVPFEIISLKIYLH
jgi:alpha-mannosidase